MGYRVSAVMTRGSVVAVITATPQTAFAKAREYQEDGYEEVAVKDLDDKTVEIDELKALTEGSIP
ncbi:hypothetical protein [Tardiphaga sp.]|uniref:hypothetical protein n=1 Tax=Tardiphaga sp. TaxID=1926292 RepID=UPI0026232FD3|nr:hypothetical protein [Tardiphaga sp.]MDB5617269.1 hypothetical protein [Tardiphaga sp.]